MLRENKGRIKYWQGRANMETSSIDRIPLQPNVPDGKAGISKRKTRAVFWYSADLEATRWKISTEGRYYDDKGQPISDLFQGTYDEMIKGGTFYRYMDYFVLPDGKRAKGLTLWPADKARQSGISSSFDPMYFFTHDGHDTIQKLDVYSTLVAKGRKDVTVRQEGQRVTLQEDFDEGRISHVFDLSQGGNQVEYATDVAGPRARTGRQTWSYRKIGDAWVPTAWSRTRDGHPETSVTLADIRVNEPISPSEFTPESLGVKQGDPVSDTVAKLAYRYGTPSDILPDIPHKDATPGVPQERDKP